MAKYELSISYLADHYPHGDKMVEEILGVENAGDTGMGFGLRDMHWNYSEESEAIEASKKLKKLSIAHSWTVEWWDLDAEEKFPYDEDKWHRLIDEGGSIK